METQDQYLISIAKGTHSIAQVEAHTHRVILNWHPSPRSLSLCSSLSYDLEGVMKEYESPGPSSFYK